MSGLPTPPSPETGGELATSGTALTERRTRDETRLPSGDKGRGVSFPRVITIDGPAGVGKTSVAEEIAERIGYHVYDTGALYRAATLLAVRAGLTDVTADDEARLVQLIAAADIHVGPPTDARSEPVVTINGEDVTADLRAPAVNRLVSPVSQVRGVRAALLAVQRKAADAGGVIMVGRDMGTVVAPNADLKLYFDADVQVRAERRAKQLAERGHPRPLDEIQREEAERDRLDSNRAIAPLRPASDAVHINTEGPLQEVVARVMAAIEQAENPPPPPSRRGRGGAAKSVVSSPDTTVAAPGAHPLTRFGRVGGLRADGGGSPARDTRDRVAPFRFTRAFRTSYHATRWLVKALLFPLARVEVRGEIPKEAMHGPLIVASNHLHNFDPLVIGAYVPRNLLYMSKKELFTIPILGRLVRYYGGFPVDRGTADRVALRYATHVVEDGEALGMFPEGTRSLTGRIEKVMPGAGFVAMRLDPPILPVAITGTQTLPLDRKSAKAGKRRWGRAHVTMIIGPLFHLTPGPGGKRPSLADATDEIMRHVAALLPPDYRGIYGDDDDATEGNP